MAIDKITPNDSRIKHQYAEVGGHRWHYLDAHPQGQQQKATIILIHGFPDISLAWRYQIPMLLSLGIRCIALDCMGYGSTGTSSNLKDFTLKTHADAIAGIAKSINAPKIILGGHDWGGMVVYRAAQWYPELVSHVFSVATPFWGPSEEYVSLEEAVRGPIPWFAYQLQFGSEDFKIERAVEGSEGKLRKLLCGLFGGRVRSGKTFMTPEKGIDLSILEDGEEVGMTPLLNEEELDYYVAQLSKNGLNGPCNWYRTRKLTWEEEQTMPAENSKGPKQPTLFIQALNDNVLIPEMSRGMEEKIPNLTRGEVDTGHWALWQTPQETNEIIKRWFEGVVFGGKSKI